MKVFFFNGCYLEPWLRTPLPFVLLWVWVPTGRVKTVGKLIYLTGPTISQTLSLPYFLAHFAFPSHNNFAFCIHQHEPGATPHYHSNDSYWFLDTSEWLHIYLTPLCAISCTSSIKDSSKFWPTRWPHLHWEGIGGGLLPTNMSQGIHHISIQRAAPGSSKQHNGYTSTSHPLHAIFSGCRIETAPEIGQQMTTPPLYKHWMRSTAVVTM